MVGEVLEGWLEGLCSDKADPLSIIAFADAAVGQRGLKGGDRRTHGYVFTYG